MSVKDKLDKALDRARQDVAEARAPVDKQIEKMREDDPELANAMERVQRGELRIARRTNNGALRETH